MINTYKYPCVILPERLKAARECTIKVSGDCSHKSENADAKVSVYKTSIYGVIMFVATVCAFMIYEYCGGNAVWADFLLPMALGVAFAYAVCEYEDNEVKEYLNEKNAREYSNSVKKRVEDDRKRIKYEKQSVDVNLLKNFRAEQVSRALFYTDMQTFPCQDKKKIAYKNFHEKMTECFDSNLYYNRYVKSVSGEVVVPDYMLVFENKNFAIAVEIDIPYSLDTREPEDYFNVVDNGTVFSFQEENNILLDKGWCVIRFSEKQIVDQPLQCCKLISEIAGIFIGDDFSDILELDKKSDNVVRENFWSLEQCKFYAVHNFRESYLGDIFKEETKKIENVVEEEKVEEEKVENVVEEEKEEVVVEEEEKEEEVVETEKEKEIEPEDTVEKVDFKDDVEEVKEVNEEDIAPLLSRISECYTLENWERLIEACNELLALKPDSDIAYLRRGSAYGSLGVYDNAVSDFEKAVSINPENPNVYYNLGIVNFMLKNHNVAIDNLKKAVDKGIENKRRVYATIADIYNEISDAENYLKYLQLSSLPQEDIVVEAADVKTEVESQKLLDYVLENITVFRTSISEAVFGPNDMYIAISSVERNLKIFSSDFNLVSDNNYSALVMAFGKNYLALGGHGVLKILNINDNFSLYADLAVSLPVAKKMFFLPQNDSVLFVSDNYNVWSVDIKTGETVKVIKDFKLLSLSVYGDYVIGKDYLNMLKVYTSAGMKELISMKIPFDMQLKTAVLNRVSSQVILCGKEGKIKIFDIKTGNCLSEVDLKSEVVQVEISTGEYYAILTSDRKLRLFDMVTSELKRIFQLQDMPKLIKFSNKGKKMAVCGFDGTLRIVSLDKA